MRSVKALIGTGMIMLLAAAANAGAGEVDLSGAWQLEITSPQGTRTPTMKLNRKPRSGRSGMRKTKRLMEGPARRTIPARGILDARVRRGQSSGLSRLG